jgi:hypothetical protein
MPHKNPQYRFGNYAQGELPQVLTFELEQPKSNFIKRHKKAIIAVSATVLAAAILGAVAFVAWPAVAAAVLGVGAYGLTLGALAGANLIAQVGLVAAVFAVGGFIAGGGLVAAGSKVINWIENAWNALYKSSVDINAKPTVEQPQSYMTIQESLEKIANTPNKNAPLLPLSLSTPSTIDSGQQKEEKNLRVELHNINQTLAHDNPSEQQCKILENKAEVLEKEILSQGSTPSF